MYNVELAGWGTELKQVISETIAPVVTAVIEPTTEALISYFDREGIKVWRRARPVLERFTDKHGDEMAEGIKPAMTRMLDRQRKSYGRKSFYPRYGKYAPLAIAAGSVLLVGSLGTGYKTLEAVKEQDSKAAAPWLVGSYLLGLGGLAVVVMGTLLAVGNAAFPKE